MRLRKDIEPGQLCAVCAAGLYTADYAGRLYCVYTMWSSTGSSVHLWGHKSISLHVQLNYDDSVPLLVETNCLFIYLSVDRKPVKWSRITFIICQVVTKWIFSGSNFWNCNVKWFSHGCRVQRCRTYFKCDISTLYCKCLCLMYLTFICTFNPVNNHLHMC